jgi:hypothetical protein
MGAMPSSGLCRVGAEHALVRRLGEIAARHNLER